MRTVRASGPAFTLIELLMSLAAAAVILIAVYGVFSKAVHLRDAATERTHEARVRAHALGVMRNDLQNALISGGTLAAALTGSRDSKASSFPGYLKLTTTSGLGEGETLATDVQQVEYYVVNDAEARDGKSGVLVRAVDPAILAPVRETPAEHPLLTGIESMEVEFFDGTTWQTSWEVTEEDKTLPKAVRVRLQPAGTGDRSSDKPAPLELTVPWATQAFIEAPATAEGTTP